MQADFALRPPLTNAPGSGGTTDSRTVDIAHAPRRDQVQSQPATRPLTAVGVSCSGPGDVLKQVDRFIAQGLLDAAISLAKTLITPSAEPLARYDAALKAANAHLLAGELGDAAVMLDGMDKLLASCDCDFQATEARLCLARMDRLGAPRQTYEQVFARWNRPDPTGPRHARAISAL